MVDKHWADQHFGQATKARPAPAPPARRAGLYAYAATNAHRQAAAINALRHGDNLESWSSVRPVDLSEIVPKHLAP